jgi:acid phosphatase type 7
MDHSSRETASGLRAWNTARSMLCMLGACAIPDATEIRGVDTETAGGVVATATVTWPRETPPAEDTSIHALTPFEARCGKGRTTRDGAEQLARLPYLQRVSATSATVLYARRDGSPVTDEIEITEPGGALVMHVSAEVDPSAPNGLQRVAVVQGLVPRTYYCYSIVGLTGRIGFRTAPAPDTGAVVRFAVFGDSGSGSVAQTSVRDQIEAHAIDLILHTGDVAYEQGSLAQFEQNFFRIYQNLLKSIPVFPVPGNHEYATDSAAPYLEVFNLPENGSPGASERWYSFDWGDVHFVALDTERADAEQAEWLERDLAANVLRWTVVYFHRPPYSSGVHGNSAHVEAAFVPVFQRQGVPIVFSGHDHDYERTQPMSGVTYVVTGGGGKSLRSVGRSAFTAHSESVMHFVWVELKADVMRLRAIDAAGAEIDSVEIER